mmetsp:Transcript_68354/g.211327  ORF Transcript_68354/g.211327 Transcript_68354/m.211327 type:complete len:271 (+) Transcript_68354:796-1608(+)
MHRRGRQHAEARAPGQGVADPGCQDRGAVSGAHQRPSGEHDPLQVDRESPQLVGRVRLHGVRGQERLHLRIRLLRRRTHDGGHHLDLGQLGLRHRLALVEAAGARSPAALGLAGAVLGAATRPGLRLPPALRPGPPALPPVPALGPLPRGAPPRRALPRPAPAVRARAAPLPRLLGALLPSLGKRRRLRARAGPLLLAAALPGPRAVLALLLVAAHQLRTGCKLFGGGERHRVESSGPPHCPWTIAAAVPRVPLRAEAMRGNMCDGLGET